MRSVLPQVEPELLHTLIEAVGMFSYRGCLVERIDDTHWKVFDCLCSSVEEVDEKIDAVFVWLGKSIK